MYSFSDLFQQPATIWTLVSFLVAWAMLSAMWAEVRVRSILGAIRATRARLAILPDAAALTRDYETLSSDLLSIKLIGPLWRGYRETLLIDDSGRRPVRATVAAEHWFNSSLLREARLDPRYHTALPGLLVGAGLLCTFLGLTLALGKASAVVADGVSQAQRTHALQQLLDLASFKFITSLAGLSMSIFYTLFWKKRCLSRVERAIAGLVEDLHYRIPLRTELAAQEEANALSERQLVQLEMFSTDLAVSVGEKLDSAFNQRLGEHIGPLREALERLAARSADDNTAMIQRMLDAFLEGLRGGAATRWRTSPPVSLSWARD